MSLLGLTISSAVKPLHRWESLVDGALQIMSAALVELDSLRDARADTKVRAKGRELGKPPGRIFDDAPFGVHIRRVFCRTAACTCKRSDSSHPRRLAGGARGGKLSSEQVAEGPKEGGSSYSARKNDSILSNVAARVDARLTSLSHTRRTDQPSNPSASSTCWSRSIFLRSLRAQSLSGPCFCSIRFNSRPCQKSPSMKTASFLRGRARSGEPVTFA